ncbi:hypothetical protein U1Q18_015748 [Sarracenia purpurea var. burkii]
MSACQVLDVQPDPAVIVERMPKYVLMHDAKELVVKFDPKAIAIDLRDTSLPCVGCIEEQLAQMVHQAQCIHVGSKLGRIIVDWVAEEAKLVLTEVQLAEIEAKLAKM